MWSRQLKPITSTERRETPRFEYHVAGMVRVQMDEHTELHAHRGRRDGAFVGPQCESRGQQGGRRRLVRRMELREVGSAFHRSDDRTISRLYGVDERPAQCPTRALQPPKMCRVSAPLNVTVVPFRARQLSQALDPADIRTARRVPDPEHRVAGPSARRARLPRTNSATVSRTTYPWRAPDRLTSS